MFCIQTEEGWLYLAAVKDPTTEEIVGQSMSTRLKSTRCENALKMAIRSDAHQGRSAACALRVH